MELGVEKGQRSRCKWFLGGLGGQTQKARPLNGDDLNMSAYWAIRWGCQNRKGGHTPPWFREALFGLRVEAGQS